MNKTPEIIIVGGGFGGITAARKLKNTGWNLTLIDKKNHHLFQPLLYQVATAALSPGDIAVPIRGIFSKDDNIRTVMDKVLSIDAENNTLELENGENLSFDYLVLAPGAVYNYFGNDDWKKSAPGLKTLGNALSIRERILLSLEKADRIDHPEKRKPYLTYAVIGGGPTGVEMAGAIAEISKRNMMRDFRNLSTDETEVYLVEAAGRILNGYPESLSEKAKQDLEGMGVRVLLNTPVKEIRKNGVVVSDSFIETPNIVWAAGVKTAPLLQTLSADADKMGRIKVRPDLTVPGNDHIFVIGDAAYVEDDDGNPLPALAPVAIQQGKYVAEQIKERVKGRDIKPFSYVDKGSMATIGRAKAVADIRGFKFSGFFAWLLWSFIHIFFLIGFRNRFRVFAEWIWHYITFKRGVRLITNSGKERTEED
ncbi:NAD(P)/FAD-dependent oxidoreductase [Rhodohalobacter mucosus]|uniref:NADH:ubiquinone reductase (non-electrogenic) n=1 Tax=Rhodohalobacter mucosus TaxID=2079485 RepID=A0A316TS12_9BACT|nr:NAD(P)/FAD-dependent oxidoreductase [Rhodohalobacter mucosus]PWN05805.1 FAD-dependent oxidoreductase [Rhodohalobacter mucosus]